MQSRPQTRFLSKETRGWLNAIAFALCLAALIALLCHAGLCVERGRLA